MAQGVDGPALAAQAGIDLARINHPDARVSIAANTELWRRAVRTTGDSGFGLAVARHATYTTFQILGAAALASGTLRDAFGRLVRYGRLISDGGTLRLDGARDRVRLVLDVVSGTAPADEAIDAVLSVALRAGRLLSERRELSPLRVELRRHEPPAADVFRRFFRAPITYRAPDDALEFAARDVDAPLPARNPAVARWLDDALAHAVARLDDHQIVSRVRVALAERFPDSEPAQEAVAERVGLTPRTLQRRLAQAGTSYQSLLNETRMALARSYLAGGWSITEIALALGFSDASSFARAFRRWTGRSPSEAPERAFGTAKKS